MTRLTPIITSPIENRHQIAATSFGLVVRNEARIGPTPRLLLDLADEEGRDAGLAPPVALDLSRVTLHRAPHDGLEGG